MVADNNNKKLYASQYWKNIINNVLLAPVVTKISFSK